MERGKKLLAVILTVGMLFTMLTTMSFATIPTYTITVHTTGEGSVDIDPDRTYYHYWDEVTLTATPDQGSEFEKWTGDYGTSNDASSSEISVRMHYNRELTAHFKKIEYTVTASSGDNGTVSFTPETGPYYYGDKVNFTADPNPGYEVDEWIGVDQVMEDPTQASLEVDENEVVHVSFKPIEYTVSADTDGNGSVSFTPDDGPYYYGDEIIFTAEPAPGYEVDEWNGVDQVMEDPTQASLEVDENEVVHVSFKKLPQPEQQTLSLSVVPEGGGTITCNEESEIIGGNYTFSQDASVILEAEPEVGYQFLKWQGNITEETDESSTNPLTVTMSTDHDITAVFEQIEYHVAAEVRYGEGTVGVVPNEGIHYNDSVTFTATPAADYRFEGWYILDEVFSFVSGDEEYTTPVHSDLTLFAAFTLIERAGMEAEKTAKSGTKLIDDDTVISSGSTVTYSVYVSNTGDIPLVNVEIRDDMLNGTNDVDFIIPYIGVGNTESISYSAVLTKTTTNTANIRAYLDETQEPLPTAVLLSEEETEDYKDYIECNVEKTVKVSQKKDTEKESRQRSQSTKYYTLNVKIEGKGSIMPSSSRSYESGTVVVFSNIKPSDGWEFDGLYESETLLSENRVTMYKDRTIVARFIEIVGVEEEEVPQGAPETTPAPVPTVAPTQTPPEPEPETDEEDQSPPDTIILDEPVPASEPVLPKTGGIPSMALYGMGAALTGAGLVIRKKKK